MYGYDPTDTTTFAAVHAVDDLPENALRVPIWRPLRATRIYVLDTALDPVPRGVSGDLWIGGDALVDGYVNRPGLTAEGVVADPFATTPGARMYRTGDRVRRRADGALDYRGRSDSQLKLRGFQIEPGEIEATLKTITGRAQVAVDPREITEDRVLVAWLVHPERPTDEHLADWRQAPRHHLSAYMIQRHLIPLDSLPLTPTRRCRPAPAPSPSPHP
ncbi:MAG: AMP-binding protein [Rhodospirillum sp.]|nr:AMP-binding protein [Rhodospirillum sp.]MCF8489241.1 AMP-binding protein [Rhodospirillum sp.]MCF8500522.1 AMP-binding protein [Rhodospirillum sp.]